MSAVHVFSPSHPVLNSRRPFGRRAFLLQLFLILAAGSNVWAANCTSAPAGLVAWWPGEGNANDVVGTNNATLMGGAIANAPGYVGTAFKFDGTNGYAQIPSSTALEPATLTIEGWVRFDSLDSVANRVGQQYMIYKTSTVGPAYVLGKDRLAKYNPYGDYFFFGVMSSGGTLVEAYSSVSTITAGVWYHVAAVRGSNYIQLYINGHLEEAAQADFPQDYDGHWPVYFGTSGQAWDGKLNGRLDEFSLYSRALSSNEIAAIYQAGSGGKCKAPALLIQPSGQTCYWGGSVTFTSAVAGVNPLVYHWQDNGGVIPAATNSTLQLTNLQMTNAGNYVVLVTNVDGSVTSSPALLKMKVDDVAFKLVSLGGARKGASLTVSGVSNKTYGIQYSSNLTRWFGLTNLTLTAPTNVWLDPQAATQAARFYRVGQGPIPIP